MQYIYVLLVVAAVFGLCFLVDKGFTALFRSKSQHRSGKAVRQTKRYGSFGLILAIFGILCLFSAPANTWLLYPLGGILVAGGTVMVIYYMSFGIYYDEETFLVERFGKKSQVYRYGQIRTQNLYTAGNTVIVELYFDDGKTLQIQSGMDGFLKFLDTAYEKWIQQKGCAPEECAFHDRENFRWFPSAQEE